MKLPNKYVCIDIETTDSEADKGDVVQIGAIILNEDLSHTEEFMSYLKPMSAHRSRRAMEVNHIEEDILSFADDANDVLYRFEKWAIEKTGEDRPLLASWGTYFDVTFLRQFYKKLGRKWIFSYRCLDLKSIAIWEISKKGGDTAAGGVDTFLGFLGLEFEGKPHDALDDIKNTIKIIQNL